MYRAITMSKLHPTRIRWHRRLSDRVEWHVRHGGDERLCWHGHARV